MQPLNSRLGPRHAADVKLGYPETSSFFLVDSEKTIVISCDSENQDETVVPDQKSAMVFFFLHPNIHEPQMIDFRVEVRAQCDYRGCTWYRLGKTIAPAGL